MKKGSYSFQNNVTSKTNKGPSNNYVDKIRGEGVKKYMFLTTLRV